jgi:hypothetical protein
MFRSSTERSEDDNVATVYVVWPSRSKLFAAPGR